MSRVEADFLRAIYDAPADDAPRLVYADWLQEQRDGAARARGEFIALQVSRAQGRAAPDGEARERAFQKRYGRAWVGPLATVVEQPEFERGFLGRCVVCARDERALATEFAHVEWATVRELRFGEAFRGRITPAMRALERAEQVDAPALRALCEAGHPALRELGLGPSRDDSDDVLARAAALDALGRCEALPALRKLRVGGAFAEPPRGAVRASALEDDHAWLFRAPWLPRLEFLGVTCDPGRPDVVSAWRDAAARAGGSLATLDLRPMTWGVFESAGWALRLERDATGAFSRARLLEQSGPGIFRARTDDALGDALLRRLRAAASLGLASIAIDSPYPRDVPDAFARAARGILARVPEVTWPAVWTGAP